MSTWTERAFDLVTEISKQVITLSTAVIALGITFGKDFAGSGAGSNPWWWGSSWILFVLAILCAVATLMASTGTQANAQTEKPDPYAGSVRFFGALQLVFFLLGIMLSVIAGILSL